MGNSLISVIFKNTRRNTGNKGKNSLVLATLAFIIVFGSLAIAMGYASYYVIDQLDRIHQPYAFINFLLVMNFVLLFAKSIFESLNVLYFSKDLSALLRMPIKPHKIVNAKLINMIISEYEMELLMLAIPMAIYGVYESVKWPFYLYIALIMIVLPVIPIVLTTLIIAIIMRFTNFIKNKSKVMYITIIMTIFVSNLVLALMSNDFSQYNVGAFTRVIFSFNGLAYSISDSFRIIKPIMNVLLGYDGIVGVRNIVIYYIENIIFYIVSVFIMGKIYLKGAIGTTTVGDTKKYTKDVVLFLNDFKPKSKAQAYRTKEWKTLSRSPIFFIQCIIMPILYPIIVGTILIGLLLFAKLVGLDLIEQFKDKIQTGIGACIILGVGEVFYMMNFSSIISISREGYFSIINKTIPISLKKQFDYKASIGIGVNSLTSLMVTIAFALFTENTILIGLVFVDTFLLNMFGEKIKIIIDLSNPHLDWNSEYTMMKQNTNIMYVLFLTGAIVLMLYLLSKFFVKVELYLIVVFAVAVFANVILSELINYKNKNNKLFERVF